jgi:hypothetical protein
MHKLHLEGSFVGTIPVQDRLSCVPRRAPIVLLHRWSMEQGLDPLGLPMNVPWSGHCVSAQSQRPRTVASKGSQVTSRSLIVLRLSTVTVAITV